MPDSRFGLSSTEIAEAMGVAGPLGEGALGRRWKLNTGDTKIIYPCAM